jgi:hypothetical protein
LDPLKGEVAIRTGQIVDRPVAALAHFVAIRFWRLNSNSLNTKDGRVETIPVRLVIPAGHSNRFDEESDFLSNFSNGRYVRRFS